MSGPIAAIESTAWGGSLLVLSIVVPVAAALVAFVAGGRRSAWIALAALPVGLAVAVAIAVGVPQAGGTLVEFKCLKQREGAALPIEVPIDVTTGAIAEEVQS